MAALAHSTILLANFAQRTRMSKVHRALLTNREYKMKVSYQLKRTHSRLFHQLPSGLKMEVIFQKGNLESEEDKKSLNPPLVFVHGSFHAAWCWAEHFLPFFSENGYELTIVMLSALWVRAKVMILLVRLLAHSSRHMLVILLTSSENKLIFLQC